MEYDDLSKKIRRYSLDDLVSYCCYKSSLFMNGLENKPNGYSPWPWVIDTLATFAIKYAGENKIQRDFDIKAFDDMYITIMDHVPDFIKKNPKLFVLSEFGLQNKYYNHLYKLYRHNWLFSHNCLKDEYKARYEKNYLEYLAFAYIIFRWFDYFKYLNNLKDGYRFVHIYTYIYHKYLALVNKGNLSISRDEFKDYYSAYNDDDLKYYLSLLWHCPFVTEGLNVFTPCPYHIVDAVTTSFVFKLTKDRNEIRDLFGRALECFVYELIANAGQFDEVKSEFEYGDSQKTSDVMARCDNNYVFFECKAFTPSMQVLLGNEQKIRESIERLAKAVVQIYKNLFVKFQNNYWFDQQHHEDSVSNDRRWGIVIVNENLFLDNITPIYEKAAELLGLDNNSTEYLFLCAHIAIADIDEFEKCCLLGENIFSKLLCRKHTGDLYSIFLFDNKKRTIDTSKNKNYIEYNNLAEKLKNINKQLIFELNQKGLLPN